MTQEPLRCSRRVQSRREMERIPRAHTHTFSERQNDCAIDSGRCLLRGRQWIVRRPALGCLSSVGPTGIARLRTLLRGNRAAIIGNAANLDASCGVSAFRSNLCLRFRLPPTLSSIARLVHCVARRVRRHIGSWNILLGVSWRTDTHRHNSHCEESHYRTPRRRRIAIGSTKRHIAQPFRSGEESRSTQM